MIGDNFIGFSSLCLSHELLPKHFARTLDILECGMSQFYFFCTCTCKATFETPNVLKRTTFDVCEQCIKPKAMDLMGTLKVVGIPFGWLTFLTLDF